MKRLIVITVLLFVYGRPTTSLACRPSSGHLTPSNFNLVKDAEAIVLAEANAANDSEAAALLKAMR